ARVAQRPLRATGSMTCADELEAVSEWHGGGSSSDWRGVRRRLRCQLRAHEVARRLDLRLLEVLDHQRAIVAALAQQVHEKRPVQHARPGPRQGALTLPGTGR